MASGRGALDPSLHAQISATYPKIQAAMLELCLVLLLLPAI
jgi:hypothetical protein